jgi:GAF domain-containing protein
MADLLAKIRRLDEAGKYLNAGAEELCRRIAERASEVFERDATQFFLADNADRLVLAAHQNCIGFHGQKILSDIADLCAKDKAPVLIPDLKNDPKWAGGDMAVSSLMAAPVLYDGKILGVLEVFGSKPGSFDDFDLGLLLNYANLAACALQGASVKSGNQARLDFSKNRSECFDLVHKSGQAAINEPTLEESMRKMAEMIAEGLRYEHAVIMLLDPELEELEVVSSHGCGDVEGLCIPVSRGATGYAVRHGEAVNVPDVKTDPRYVQGSRWSRSELAVPIIFRGAVLGVINVESPLAGAFSDEDIELLSMAAFYASVAVSAAKSKENLYSERAARQRLDLEVKLLSQVSKTLSSIDTLPALRSETLRLTGEILGWGDSAVWVIEPESGQLVVSQTRGNTGIEVGQRLQMGQGAPGRAATSNVPVNETSHNKGEPGSDIFGDRPQMAVSLWDGREITCVLHIIGDEADFTPGDLALLSVFAGQISTSFTAIRSRKDTMRQIAVLDDRTRRLDLLNRVTRSLTGRMKIDELLEELLKLCAEAFDLDHCALLLLDTSRQNLKLKASIGYDESAPKTLTLKEGITGHVATTGVPILVGDVTKDPRHITGVSGSRSEMAVPLKVFGEIIGVLDVESVEESAFDEEDLDLITCFAAQAAVAIRNAEATSGITVGKGC